MTINKFYIISFLSIICSIQVKGQKSDKFYGLTDSEIKIYQDFTKQNIDTVLFLSFKSFAYSIKDTSFRSMVLWQKNGVIFKKIVRYPVLSEQAIAINSSLFANFFKDDINSKKAVNIKFNYWKKHRLGWINPLGNYNSIHFFYKKKYYRETFLENSDIYGSTQMAKILKKELNWLEQLRAEMYK